MQHGQRGYHVLPARSPAIHFLYLYILPEELIQPELRSALLEYSFKLILKQEAKLFPYQNPVYVLGLSPSMLAYIELTGIVHQLLKYAKS
jgi:hypothetical protein